MATITEVEESVRELIFDRFPIPVFVLKAKTGYTLTINSTSFVITNGTITITALFSTYDTLKELTDYLISQGIVLAYGGYYRDSSPCTSLLNRTSSPLTQDSFVLTKNFYSTEAITNQVISYFNVTLKYIDAVNSSNLQDYLTPLTEKSLTHLCLHTAISLVDMRRMYEAGNIAFGQYFSDGSGTMFTGPYSMAGDSINVNIGQVFSLSEDDSTAAMSGNDNWNMAGSEIFFGDKNSFWYRLFCWLRDRLEHKFEDYEFRTNVGITSKAILDRPLNFRSYFDSYPFTLSPYTRQIINP